MVVSSRDSSDWLPIPESHLILANEHSRIYHLLSCEYGGGTYRPHARFYLLAQHAETDGYRSCNECFAGQRHAALICLFTLNDLIRGFDRASRLARERTSEETAKRLAALQAKLEAHRVEADKRIWPLGRLVGATVTVRWDDGTIRSMFVVDGEEELGNGKDLLSVLAPLGKALVDADIGDVAEYEAPGGVEEVRLLGVSLPHDWPPEILE